MNLTSDTIKQGASQVGNCRMEYTVTYNGEGKVSKVEAQVKKAPDGKVTAHAGYASFIVETGRYSFQVTDVTNEERKALIDDFNHSIDDLMK